MIDATTRKYAFFVCHHKSGQIYHDDIFTPIHVGAATASRALPNCVRDDTGENISHKNASFCELTALYWMWKNVDAQYYGLFHYRRLLNFKRLHSRTLHFHDFSSKQLEELGWNDSAISAICGKYDIVTSPRWNVHPVGLNRMIMTNYEFYAREHHIGDLDIVLELVKEQSPDIYPYVLRYVHSKQCTFANIAVMRKDYFEQYASWLFPILFAAEQKIDTSSYDPHQKRVFGFLSERLCGAYIDYLQATQNARVTQLGVAFGSFAKPVTDGALVLNTIAEQAARARELLIAEQVHVTFAIDNNYAPHCGAAIASLIGAIHPQQLLTIHILHDESLSGKNQLLLASLTKETAATVEFVDVDSRGLEIFPDNRAHISRATYFRLMLHKLLPETVEKTIYIDADVILADNICKIWLDLGDSFAAACADEGGVLQSRRLGLPITHSYFNAGVCVFNLKKLRGIDADALYLTAYLDNKALITLQDQDILNIAFRNDAIELPLRWNANARLYRWNDLDYRYSEDEAQAAALKPGLIHFTDSSKPWHSHCQHPLAPLYWQWRQTTPWARRGVQHIRLFSVRAMIDRILSAGRRLEQDFRPYLKALKLRFQEKHRR